MKKMHSEPLRDINIISKLDKTIDLLFVSVETLSVPLSKCQFQNTLSLITVGLYLT